MRIIMRHAIVQSIVIPICRNLGRGLRAIFYRPKQFSPVKQSPPRSSIDHFCPRRRRGTRQLRRRESTEKRFYGRRTPLHPSCDSHLLPDFRCRWQTLKIPSADFVARESVYFRLPAEGIVSCKQISTTRLAGLFDSYSFLKTFVYIGCSCEK